MMKNQIAFFISLLLSAILLIFMIFYLLYVDQNQPASLYGVASIELTGLEYKSANGYLNSLIFYDNIQVPVIDLYAGYNNNPYIQGYIINQSINDTLSYLDDSSTLLYFNFFGNQIGICFNQEPVQYYFYFDGNKVSYYICAPTTLSVYYYNISCVQ